MDDNQIQDIATQWNDLLIRGGEGLPREEYLAGAEQLTDQLAGASSPDAALLRNRIRLHALHSLIQLDPVAAVEELIALIETYEADPAVFPLNPFDAPGNNPPVDDEGNVTMNWLVELIHPLIFQIARDERTTRADSDALVDLAARVTDDPDLLRHFQISTLQMNNAAEEVLPLLDGYIPPLEVLERGEMDPTIWLDRYDKAAMAYLETGHLDEVSELTTRMMEAGALTSNQPMAMVAETLVPLAVHVENELSVERARFVLAQSVADTHQPTAVIQAATFLLLGGLGDRALALVSATEPFITETEEEITALARFFRAADEAGLGGRTLPRFGSPRWQMEQGLPAEATCSALAKRFGELASAKAARRDTRNGDSFYTDELQQRFEVPKLNPEHFGRTAVAVVPPLPPTPLTFDPVSATYDPELTAYARGVLDMDHGAPFPSYADAHGDVRALREELAAINDVERATEIVTQLLAIANDPGVERRVRDAVDLLIQANFAPPFTFAAEAAVRPLPMLANLDPARAAVLATVTLQVLSSQEEKHSPAATALFELAMGLVSTTSVEHEALIQLALATDNAGRDMDAIACVDAARTARAADPTLVENPEGFAADFEAMRGACLANLGAHMRGAEELLEAANTAGRLGDANNSLLRASAALDVLVDGAIYGPAQSVAQGLTAVLTDSDDPHSAAEPFRRSQASASIAKLTCQIADPYFHNEWPPVKALLQHEVTRAAGTTESDAVAQQVGTVSRYLIGNDRHQEAEELTSWAVQTFGEHGDSKEVLFALCDNAVALHTASKDEEAAMVLESTFQRARSLGRQDAMQWAVAYLQDFAESTGNPAYADVLQRLS